MHKVTRRAMFETNSSSTHSITIVNGTADDKLPVRAGVCRIYPGEFGWEAEDYTDAATKASYCLTYAKNDGAPDRLLKMLEEVIKEATGAEKVEFTERHSEFYPWGYIDHQSGLTESDVCSEAFESKEKLKNFIFCSKSLLHTGNDNE